MQVDKLRNRTRLVSFRVSPGEYELLLQTCRASDSRNISEFARSATMRLSTLSGASEHPEAIGGLAESIGLLLRKLEQLETRIDQVQGALTKMGRTDPNAPDEAAVKANGTDGEEV